MRIVSAFCDETTQNTFETQHHKSNNHGCANQLKYKYQQQSNETMHCDWLNGAGGHTIGDLYFIFCSQKKTTQQNKKEEKNQVKHVTVICTCLMYGGLGTYSALCVHSAWCNHISVVL